MVLGYAIISMISGLTLDLFVNEDQYLPEMIDKVGVRVVIHNQSDVAFPEQDGFSIPPGMASFVGITKVCTQVKPALSSSVYTSWSSVQV